MDKLVKGTSSKFPNVIIAGAPKCGTSSLFFWLGAHPRVCASKIKETYFLGDEVNRHNSSLNLHEHGLGAYEKFFGHCDGENIRLEATPVYIYYDTPLQYLKKLPEIPKIIFILRNPGHRLYSHWRFNRYRMKNTKLSFEEYLDFSNAPANWKKNYIDNTHYINYIDKYVEELGKEHILVYQFEKMQADQKGFMKGVADDLEIDPSFYEDFDFFHRNETVAVKNKKLHRLGLKIEPLVPQWLQEKIIPLYLKLNAGKTPPISEKDKHLREKANEQFAESNRKLAEEFPSIDLGLW